MTEEDTFQWYVKTSKKNYILNLLTSFLAAITFLFYKNSKISFTPYMLLLSFLAIFILTYRIMEYPLTGKIIVQSQLPKYTNTGLAGFFWFIVYLTMLLSLFSI